MAFKPNYRQERAERDRRARLKKDEKRQAREEKTMDRKSVQEPQPDAPPEDENGGP